MGLYLARAFMSFEENDSNHSTPIRKANDKFNHLFQFIFIIGQQINQLFIIKRQICQIITTSGAALDIYRPSNGAHIRHARRL